MSQRRDAMTDAMDRGIDQHIRSSTRSGRALTVLEGVTAARHPKQALLSGGVKAGMDLWRRHTERRSARGRRR